MQTRITVRSRRRKKTRQNERKESGSAGGRTKRWQMGQKRGGKKAIDQEGGPVH